MNVIIFCVVCIAFTNGQFINDECVSVSSKECGTEEFQIHYTKPSQETDSALCGGDDMCLEHAKETRNLKRNLHAFGRTHFNEQGQRIKPDYHATCPVFDVKAPTQGLSRVGSISLSPWRWIVNENSTRHEDDRYILETECLCKLCRSVHGRGVSPHTRSQDVEIERYVRVITPGTEEYHIEKQTFTYGCTCVYEN